MNLSISIKTYELKGGSDSIPAGLDAETELMLKFFPNSKTII